MGGAICPRPHGAVAPARRLPAAPRPGHGAPCQTPADSNRPYSIVNRSITITHHGRVCPFDGSSIVES